jgi:hypothetical protein
MVLSGVEVAASFGKRLRGLLGRDGIPPQAGLLLAGVNGVHTFGMGFPIDVLFLDRDGTILKVVPGMTPGRMARAVPGAASCLELAAGAAARHQLEPGTRLRFGS